MAEGKQKSGAEEFRATATYRQLMWRRFRKHRLAMVGVVILAIMYLCAIFCGFVCPYGKNTRHARYINAPPQRIRIFHDGGIRRPFVYGYKARHDEENFNRTYEADKSRRYPVKFFTRGTEYEFLGLFTTDVHLFGVDADLHGLERPGTIFLFGSDKLGRDLFSRIWYAGRITLSIGLVGVMLAFVLGVVLGGISGYYGGAIDMIIQRIIEFLVAIPKLPFWMALSAALPADWGIIKVYFGITIILSLIGWCGLGRQVRGKVLQLRGQEFVTAARLASGSDRWIISRHLLPSVMSHIIVSITLAIPGMILGETALSFLGLGIKPPAVSWGTLLHQAQHVRTMATQPWLLIPGLFVILAVTSFNFVGDGLRDAADPFAR